MAREEGYEYQSSSVPGTPMSPGNGEKKKKNPLRKFISFTTKKIPIDLDKSEKGMSKDDGGGSPSRSKRFNFFKRKPTQKDEDDAHHTKNNEPEPEHNEKTHNKALQENRPKDEGLKEETKSSKHILPTETIGEVLKLSENTKKDGQNHPHIEAGATIGDKGKSKQHQELTAVASEVQEKGLVKHDQHDHHKQTEDHKGDGKDEKSMATSEATDTPVLQEDGVGCESLAKGLQKVCLPWTINKEDH